ncbi:EAL domain-containing protein, partial [Aurantimonas aggregata]
AQKRAETSCEPLDRSKDGARLASPDDPRGKNHRKRRVLAGVHLQQFPVDVLKIDKSFVSPIVADVGSGAVVVNAVLQMARSLKIGTVAEGVETISQAEYLRARGCDIAQGYLFGRPSPADRVPALCKPSATTGYPNYLVTMIS